MTLKVSTLTKTAVGCSVFFSKAFLLREKIFENCVRYLHWLFTAVAIYIA